MALTPQKHSIPLGDGNTIPLIGLGTYSNPQNTPKGTALAAVKRAIEVGYRHIDGALIYCNEDEVGQAIREKIADGTVKREDIFYCGKPGDTFYPQDENGKCAYHKSDLCATWEAMEACKDAGLAKSIGVSNFNKRQLELILNKPGLKHKPVINQVECHPYFTQPKLREYCREKNIVIVGYSPLGTNRDPSWVNLECPPMLEDKLLTSIAQKYKKTTAQVCLRFNMQRGVVVIPKSFNLDRIKDNFQVFDFSLSEEEIKAIEGLNKNIRFVVLPFWADHPEYPFHEEY
ncbi:aldo-keto reductase family 1 member D1-like isoform X2 [Xiphophorus hellerii]|uniref:aldo-keto reductase family 1 member D1-like isoform X2 n=1 Tax=Xiphophorus hellerii TaxID=8084 RepID=UPI0013B472F3|nr:aldo-keto reductase family 1 member D1-like isoform X2 [Xiphophorus hellerii]